MAKHPVAGRVKTRLGRVLGAERACALYRAFVLDLAERLRPLPYEVTWAYWPPTAPFADVLPGSRCRPQQGSDLGERMANALAGAFAERAGPALLIGADAPHVPEGYLAEAARSLAADADLVLGPAEDGGYYLVGLNAPAPELFTAMAWSTPAVLATTVERATARGLRTHVLPSCFDVDEPEDVDRLRILLARAEVRLPRTAELLSAP